MSEPIPEAIPTSADPRSHRPLKRARVPGSGSGSNKANASAVSTQAQAITHLFLEPDKPIALPPASSTSTSGSALLPPPPEIVANVQGSSAGAGSGEFHVYKASRRREYERLRLMEEEAKVEEEDAKWAEEEKRRHEADEERTRKKREKRAKKKGKVTIGSGDGENNTKAGSGLETGPEMGGRGKSDHVVKKGLRQLPRRDAQEDEEETNGVGSAEKRVDEVGVVIHDDD